MGLLGSIWDAAVEANEEAHGIRLLRELEDTERHLAALRKDLRSQSEHTFMLLREQLLTQIPNWSLDGKLQAAKKLREEARSTYNFDLSKSYALWMASAWLESRVRQSESARKVYKSLDRTARVLSVMEERARPTKSIARSQVASGDPIEKVSRMVGSFVDDWSDALGLAGAMAGLQEMPAVGDRYLAIVWGAANRLGQSVGAHEMEIGAAINRFLSQHSDSMEVLQRMIDISDDPSYGDWVRLGEQAALSHISSGADASQTYVPFAAQYLAQGGG